MAATGFAYCANDNPIIVNSIVQYYCTLEDVPSICFWLLNTKLLYRKVKHDEFTHPPSEPNQQHSRKLRSLSVLHNTIQCADRTILHNTTNWISDTFNIQVSFSAHISCKGITLDFQYKFKEFHSLPPLFENSIEQKLEILISSNYTLDPQRPSLKLGCLNAILSRI